MAFGDRSNVSWDASTNTPALASGVGTHGQNYTVSVAGTTSIDGNASWGVGDVIIYVVNGWQRIPAFSAGTKQDFKDYLLDQSMGLPTSTGTQKFANILLTGQMIRSVAASVAAHAGGGQASATLLAADINRIVTVATAADSVKLPVSAAGLTIVVINSHASNSTNVFPQSGDAIDAGSADAAKALAAGKVASFHCVAAGNWYALLTA